MLFRSKSWFRGSAAIFSGVEYLGPRNFNFKLEYDSNNYQNEPFSKALSVRSPFNYGLVFTGWRGFELSASYYRGNTFTFGITAYTDFSTLNTPKLADETPPKVTKQFVQDEPNWHRTASDIERLTDWQIKQIYEKANKLVIQVERSANPAPQVRLDKALAILNKDAPSRIESFEFQHIAAGDVLAAQIVDRNEWVLSQIQPARTTAISSTPRAPTYEFLKVDNDSAKLKRVSKNYYVEPGLDYIQHLGGPDGFVLYQVSASLAFGLKATNDYQIKGMIRHNLINNYYRFKYDAPSNLPRVRTNIRSYFTTSDNKIGRAHV